MPEKKARDVEKGYSTKEFVAKIRRLADALEAGDAFSIQVAGERINIPAGASISVEHERSAGTEELEFQLKWEV
ncbi:MAG: amphi-Trp domain-containing protein [Anaerolineae bacterium]|nr:amphi-Trp domain-containing protein [Anaerolineae bacterium]